MEKTMKISIIITLICAIFLSIFSIYLISYQKEYENKQETKKEKYVYGKKTKIYAGSLFLLNFILGILLSFIYTGNSWMLNIKLLALISILWPIGYIDYKYMKIPNKILLAGLYLRMICLTAETILYKKAVIKILFAEFLAAIVIFLICMLLNFIMKNAVGIGDIKLLVLMALYIGDSGIIPAVVFSLFVSFFISVYFLIIGKKGKKDVIPFAPSILAGTYLSIFLLGI